MVQASEPRRVWSWARSPAEVAERRRVANLIAGQRITEINYVTIDTVAPITDPT